MPHLSSIVGCLLVSLLFLPEGAAPRARLPAPTVAAQPEPDTLELLRTTALPTRDPAALVGRLTGTTIARAEGAGPEAPFAVGRADSFWVLDQRDNTYKRQDAELRLVTPNAYWYVQRGQDVRGEELARSADQFERATYPTIRGHFGGEWSPGIDGDPRLTIYLGTVPGVSAYFSSWDEYPRAVFPYSNEREMVHLNVGSLRPGTAGFDATLAHEFQHMVHWNMNPAAETWMDEGSAELASALATGTRASGSSQFQREPDLQLTGWGGPGASGRHYQASYLFMQYFDARFRGPDGLRGLLGQPGRPPETFERYLAEAGHGLGFDEVFEDWVVANLLDDPRVEGGRYYHERSDTRMAPSGRLEPAGPAIRESVHQYGADYVELGPGGGAELEFEGAPTVRLVGAEPTSGRKLWWSNRGDNLNTALTRRFDLRDVTGPLTLRFNVWYDTEQDYDYLYVLASTDGGARWEVLRGARADDANPTGNAVGPGYSGTSDATGSGGLGGPSWMGETVDLGRFAGGELLLRFEYVTDQSYNVAGALLDDLAIPEIGYLDDAENDTGWVAEGFLRSDNTIPQRWGLRLIEHRRGGEVVVRALPVGPDGRLIEPLPRLGGGVERAVLAISGLAPRTLEKAGYRVALRPAP